MKHYLFLIVSAFLLSASACSVVTVTEPIGEEPVQLKPEQWEGLWKLYYYSFDNDEEEAFVVIEVSDSEKGVLKVTHIGRKPESFQVYLRESNGWMFGSYRDPEKPDDKDMFWGRFKKNGDRIVIWIPNYDRFSDLVKNGLLPGHPNTGEQPDNDNYLVLSGVRPEQMDLITSGSKGVLFEWEFPFFMVRVSDHID